MTHMNPVYNSSKSVLKDLITASVFEAKLLSSTIQQAAIRQHQTADRGVRQ